MQYNASAFGPTASVARAGSGSPQGTRVKLNSKTQSGIEHHWYA